MPPVKTITISYEAEELQALEILATWAWTGAGTAEWSAEHVKTIGQAEAAAYKPLQDAISDGTYRMSMAGCGAFPLARLARVQAAGRLGINEAAEAILATAGNEALLAGVLANLATKRIQGPKVEGRGRFSAFGYLEQAVSAGLTRQRALAMRGRRVLLT